MFLSLPRLQSGKCELFTELGKKQDLIWVIWVTKKDCHYLSHFFLTLADQRMAVNLTLMGFSSYPGSNQSKGNVL